MNIAVNHRGGSPSVGARQRLWRRDRSGLPTRRSCRPPLAQHASGRSARRTSRSSVRRSRPDPPKATTSPPPARGPSSVARRIGGTQRSRSPRAATSPSGSTRWLHRPAGSRRLAPALAVDRSVHRRPTVGARRRATSRSTSSRRATSAPAARRSCWTPRLQRPAIRASRRSRSHDAVSRGGYPAASRPRLCGAAECLGDLR